jgi:Arc/MetJ family transcription regulator
MRKRVAVDLDVTLVAEAASILGTRSTRATVEAALQDVVTSRRLRLLDLDPDLTLESLHQERRRAPFGS